MDDNAKQQGQKADAPEGQLTLSVTGKGEEQPQIHLASNEAFRRAYAVVLEEYDELFAALADA